VAWLGDLNSWSLHAIYRSRLSDAFDVERSIEKPPQTRDEPAGLYAQSRRKSVSITDLSNLADFPEVRICATSNIRNYGVVPTGMGAASFLFSGKHVGGDVVGYRTTSEYVAALPRSMRRFSVMDAASVPGAALAPEMGKMTRAPLRFLMALANIRLGVWIPKPAPDDKCERHGAKLRNARANLRQRFSGAGAQSGDDSAEICVPTRMQRSRPP